MTEEYLFIGVHTENKEADILAYSGDTPAEAIRKCKELNPKFRIDHWGVAQAML